MDIIIGIDVGTSRIKTRAFTETGEEICGSSTDNEVLTPQPDWAEQNMNMVWTQTAEALSELTEQIEDSRRIEAIGITGQGDGCWFIDEGGSPIRNAVLWSDGRASHILERWDQVGIEQEIAETCGSRLFPGTSLVVLRWLKETEPEVYNKIDTVFSCKDWIKYKLTGNRITDPTDASLPYLDVESGEYEPRVCERAGCPEIPEALPEYRSGTEVIGTTLPRLQQKTGIPEGIPVVSGMLDVVASGFGSGASDVGECSTVIGTTAVNQAFMDGAKIEEGDITGYTMYVGESEMWSKIMASMTGTPNIDWIRDRFLPDGSYEDLAEQARDIPLGSEGVMYHPYLSSAGERAPFSEPRARAQFTGLHQGHSNAHMIRAVYEGVALVMKDCFYHIPIPCEEIYMSGGGTQSKFWSQMFADALNTTFIVPDGSEFGARGAAMLAAVGLDYYDDLPSVTDTFVKPARTYSPREHRAKKYDRLYELYRKTYEQMFSVWDLREEVYEAIED